MSKKIHAKTFNHLTNAHTIRGRLTLKDVNERQFRNESFRELKSSKNTQRYSKNTKKNSKILKENSIYSKNTQKYWNFQKNINSLVSSYPNKIKHCRNHEDAMLKFFDKTRDQTSTISSRLTMISLFVLIAIFYVSINSFVNYIFPFTVLFIAVSFIYVMYFSLLYINNELMSLLQNDCNLFEKAEQFCVDVNKSSMSKQECVRSRYAKFEITEYHFYPEINAIALSIVHTVISHFNITILLLYCNNGRNTSQFIQHLENILNSNKIDVVFGDFNINYFNEIQVDTLKITMEQLNYIQTVQSPTFISGSLIDHVYIRNEMWNFSFDICTTVVPVYYSDHEAVKISFISK